MDEDEVRANVDKLRASLAGNQEPDELAVLALLEGALVNLARMASVVPQGYRFKDGPDQD